LVLKGYLEDEAIRLVHMKAEPAASTPEFQQEIINAIDSIGILRGYFRQIGHTANMAEVALKDAEEEHQLALEEELETEVQ